MSVGPSVEWVATGAVSGVGGDRGRQWSGWRQGPSVEWVATELEVHREPASVPVSTPQIPPKLTRARTQAAAVGSRRLTALAMARPRSSYIS
jgi:hypothetical protein